ncbi:MAG: hypothetical protein RSF73_07885, partial [Ruthenibacterium sp.]
MKFNKLHSIRYQYMLFMLLVLLIFTTVTTYLWYKETYHSAQQSAVNAVNEILNVSNENMEVVLRDMNYLVASSAVNQHEVISVLSKTDDISEQNRLNSNRK